MDDGVAVRADVGGVDGVAVVVERVGVLDLDDDRAREVRPGPVLVELVCILLLGAVVARPVEPRREIRFEVRIRRHLPPVPHVGGEVPVRDEERVARVGVRVPPLGQQHMRAELHRPAPELREQLALNPLVPDVLRGCGLFDRRDHLVELDGNRAARLGDRDGARRAVEIARRLRPLLPFTPVHRHLDRVAIAAAEGFVLVQQRLHRIRAGWNVVDALERKPERRLVERGRGTRLPRLDVDAEDQLAGRAGVDLKPGLAGALILRQHEQQPPVERLRRQRGGRGHRETKRAGLSRRCADGDRDANHDRERREEAGEKCASHSAKHRSAISDRLSAIGSQLSAIGNIIGFGGGKPEAESRQPTADSRQPTADS